MTVQDRIESFLSGKRFAVVGASRHREKYGNKVLRAYLQNNRQVVPVNPNSDIIEGLHSFPTLKSIPDPVDGVSIITPAPITEQVVQEAVNLGIKNLWMQPGAEGQHAIQLAEDSGVNLIAGGPCILVALRYHES